jgi:hypothetical protein
MTIRIPRPVAVALKAVGLVGLAYMVWKEAPPMYRYLFKFEAM